MTKIYLWVSWCRFKDIIAIEIADWEGEKYSDHVVSDMINVALFTFPISYLNSNAILKSALWYSQMYSCHFLSSALFPVLIICSMNYKYRFHPIYIILLLLHQLVNYTHVVIMTRAKFNPQSANGVSKCCISSLHDL